MPVDASPHDPITHPAVLTVGQEFALDASGARALVLREMNVKEAFTLRDAEGTFFRATLRVLTPGRAEATVYERMPASPESSARITLVCAVLARQRMMVVMQKATELGVMEIVPTFTERSVGPEGMAHEKSHVWPGQVVRAVRQCRRGSVPVVAKAVPLDTVLASSVWTGAAVRYHLDDRAAKNVGTVSLPARRDERSPLDVVLAIGPEGGFTDAERRQLDDHQSTSLRLGSRVLRAETAVLVGLTLLQHQLGDLAIT